MENKKKIIIIGAKEKISPQMLNNLQNHFDCEIEIMSAEEYMASGQTFLEALMEKEREMIEIFLRRMEAADYLPALVKNEEIKPFFPKKTGKVNNKKLAHPIKLFQHRRRTR